MFLNKLAAQNTTVHPRSQQTCWVSNSNTAPEGHKGRYTNKHIILLCVTRTKDLGDSSHWQHLVDNHALPQQKEEGGHVPAL